MEIIIPISLLVIMAFMAYLGYKKPCLTLVISPIISIFLASSLIYIENPVAVIVPFIFLVSLLGIALSNSDPDTEQWPQRIAKWILVTLMLILIVVLGFALFGLFGYWILFLVIFTTGAIIRYNLTSRYTTAAYLISTIGSTMRQNLPLAMALGAAAGEQKDITARIMRRIKKWLVQGYSLSEAIKRGYPKCPSSSIAMIAAAENINQLPSAMKAIEANMVAKSDDARRVRPVSLIYYAILIVAVFFVVITIMKFVMPNFAAILAEMFMGEKLPPATKFLVNIASYIHKAGLVIWAVIAFIIFFVVPVAIRIKLRPRKPRKPYLVSRIGDYIKWHLPISRWFENNYSLLQTVELLRLSLNTGCTVNKAIANTLELDVNYCFSRKLKQWLNKVESGEDISLAVRQSNLADSLAWAFDQQTNPGNTIAILETLESLYRSNYSYKVNLARFIMLPCITIMMGFIVGFVVYAIFSPAITIIRLLAESAIP